MIERVIDLGQESGRVAWHIDARTESIFEMARLSHWLCQRIVADRLRDRIAADIDLAEEQAALSSPEGVERIENTARIVAEHIWNRVYDRLLVKYPLVQKPPGESFPPRLPGRNPRRGQPGARDNHYVPKFTVRPWADAGGKVREFRRLSTGVVDSRLRPYARWGFEHFLYPQGLEAYFQQVESRAADPYRKVLNHLPLTPDDRYFWIAFLILQHLRTPAFMTALAAGLRQRIQAEKWAYPTTPEALRQAYFTLFEEDRLFATFYRRIDQRRWHQLVPPAGMSFPRTDVPLVVAGRVEEQNWRCVYPLTPDRCFQIGPDRATETDVPFALLANLSKEQTNALNRFLLGNARRSVVVRSVDGPDQWKVAVDDALNSRKSDEYRAWGPLDVTR